MTLEGLWDMFEGYSAEMCSRKIPLLTMGGRAEGPACADMGARTPIGASGISTIKNRPKLLLQKAKIMSGHPCARELT